MIDVSKCEFYTNVNGCVLADYISKGYKTMTNFKCKYNDCYYKQLQKIKAKNEKLKENYIRIDSLLYECEADINNLRSELQEYLQCLDEIEEIAKDKVNSCFSIRNNDCDFSCNKCLLKTLDEILQLIKQAKEGE